LPEAFPIKASDHPLGNTGILIPDSLNEWNSLLTTTD